MVAAILSRLTILVFGILYPAYSSFKAVRRKSHREYTKWMMYWIVFALFQAAEMITDTFFTWLPLYYELKIVFVLWLALPITEGSKQTYRLILHPFLLKHERKIDQGIAQAGQTGLAALKKLSQAWLNRAATTVISSAIMGQAVLTETLLKAQGKRPDGQGVAEGENEHDSPGQSHDSQFERGSQGSSSDFEPFEVIEGNSEDLVWGTSDHINSHTSSNDDNFQALNFDRTVPQGNEANIPTEI